MALVVERVAAPPATGAKDKERSFELRLLLGPQKAKNLYELINRSIASKLRLISIV